MNPETSDRSNETLADGTPVRSEDLGFSAGDLVACETCGRKNPPDRLACLYCGGSLELKAEYAGRVKTNFRKLEDWESGFNVIVSPEAIPEKKDIDGIASLVGLDPLEVGDLMAAKTPLPIGRFEKQTEAEFVAGGLKNIGLTPKIIADADLALDRPPTRLRAIDFGEGEAIFITFNSDECERVATADIALIVTGLISESKTDQIEKRKRRGNSLVLDEYETSSDETILDIYHRGNVEGFRILLTGFDFSCLGPDKEIVAARNMGRLAAKLTGFAADANVVTNYADIRHPLEAVWDVERRKGTQGMVRSGFARANFGTSVSTSNIGQFNRFSRMHRQLI